MREVAHALRAFPAILRVGFAEALAYRAEFLVWVFAYTMPIIMLALWSAVAREAPVGRYGEKEFQAYFLATLVIRLCTGAWVVWEMNLEVRQGTLQKRLLRPLHPLLTYLAENLAALPMRFAIVTPIALCAVWYVGPDVLSRDPVQWLVLPVAILGAFLLTFLAMAAIGSLSLFWESSLALFDLWLGFYVVFSGYVMPLEFFPPAARDVIDWLPFRQMLAFPVETLLGHATREETLRGLALQWAWIAVFAALALSIWRAGLRRFGAFGG